MATLSPTSRTGTPASREQRGDRRVVRGDHDETLAALLVGAQVVDGDRHGRQATRGWATTRGAGRARRGAAAARASATASRPSGPASAECLERQTPVQLARAGVRGEHIEVAGHRGGVPAHDGARQCTGRPALAGVARRPGEEGGQRAVCLRRARRRPPRGGSWPAPAAPGARSPRAPPRRGREHGHRGEGRSGGLPGRRPARGGGCAAALPPRPRSSSRGAAVRSRRRRAPGAGGTHRCVAVVTRSAARTSGPWVALQWTSDRPPRAAPLAAMVAATRTISASGTVANVMSAERTAARAVGATAAPLAFATRAACSSVRLWTATTECPAPDSAAASAEPARPAPMKASVGRDRPRVSSTVSVTS